MKQPTSQPNAEPSTTQATSSDSSPIPSLPTSSVDNPSTRGNRSKRYKRWSGEEKLAIVREVDEKGREVTLRKYGVYPSTYYTWLQKYRAKGDTAFIKSKKEAVNQPTDGVAQQTYIRKLETENALLKRLLAERDMEIALRDDLLKKNGH